MELFARKHPRLDFFDYSLPGCYYITVHLLNSDARLSEIRVQKETQAPCVILTNLGSIAQQQLLDLEQRYPYLQVDKFVIMPTHIHAMLRLRDEENKAVPRPGLTDIVCAYKSLCTRTFNQRFQTPGRKWFQTSFYEHVIRNEEGYRECWRYIDDNPAKWVAMNKPHR